MPPRRYGPANSAPVASKPRKAAGAGKKSRGPAYSNEETTVLLQLVGAILPSGSNGWTRLAQEYASQALDRKWPLRDEDSLKNKFKALKNSPKPTGDPDCPWDVKLAKRLQREIDASRDVVGFDDEDGEEEIMEEAKEDDEEYVEEDNQEQAAEDLNAEAEFEADYEAENVAPLIGSASSSNSISTKGSMNGKNSLPAVTLTPAFVPPKKGGADPGKRVGGLSEEKLLSIGAQAKRSATCGSVSVATAKRAKIDSQLDDFAASRKESSSVLQMLMLRSEEERKEERIRREEERNRREEERQEERLRRQEEREEHREQSKAMMLLLAALVNNKQ